MSNTINNSTRDENESVIRQFQIDHQLSFPMSTSKVVSLANAAGYRCDSRAIEHLFDSKQVERPVKDSNGQFSYELESVLDLFDVLESKRRWMAGHSRHIGKMTKAEIAKQTEQTQALCLKMQTWAKEQPTELLRMIVNSDSREERLAMAAMFVAKMSEGADA